MSEVTEIEKFVVGRTYSTRSACDHNCIFSYKVVARTAKRITIESRMSGRRVRGVTIYDGAETCFPEGHYSMAPIINA